uniref:Sesquiterpene synthase n=1 Tax=Quercus lobata TaxID=97700 RepID=A0A7N2MX04_QUELO
MSHQISMATAQTQNPDANVHRRSANYRPSLWGDQFLSYSNKSEETIDDSEQVQGLKEEVQRMLMAPIDNLLEKLELIDAIQRLGVSYHFEGEIDEVLQQIHSPPLATQVSHALNRPIQKCLPRVEARQYFSIYQENASHNEILLNFAKLDFNMLQKQHQKELGHISRWWKGIDVATNLSFARDRVVELYFWILGVYFEPQYSLALKILTKTICMASIIDDIYDVYGTHEELELFTDAIKRWDISCIDQLPKYMKLCYKVLLDVFEEIEEEMCKDGRLYCVYYAKVAMKKLVQAYFEEAVWLKEKYIPTMEEYMSNALISCGYLTLSTISFIGMGDIVTKAALEWVIKEPKIVRAASIINRLMDDIVSNEFEQERGHVVSGIECYMRQYGVSKQEVHDEFRKQIVNAWKDINKECFRPTEVPEPLLTRVVNLARVMDLLYKDEDAYTHLGGVMVEGITSMLVDPVPV